MANDCAENDALEATPLHSHLKPKRSGDTQPRAAHKVNAANLGSRLKLSMGLGMLGRYDPEEIRRILQGRTVASEQEATRTPIGSRLRLLALSRFSPTLKPPRKDTGRRRRDGQNAVPNRRKSVSAAGA
jgi:hypothetical protein